MKCKQCKRTTLSVNPLGKCPSCYRSESKSKCEVVDSTWLKCGGVISLKDMITEEEYQKMMDWIKDA